MVRVGPRPEPALLELLGPQKMLLTLRDTEAFWPGTLLRSSDKARPSWSPQPFWSSDFVGHLVPCQTLEIQSPDPSVCPSVRPHFRSFPFLFQCRMPVPWQPPPHPLEDPGQTPSWSEWKAPSSDGSCRCRSSGRQSSIGTRCSVRWLPWLHQGPRSWLPASGAHCNLPWVFPSNAHGICLSSSLEMYSTVITRECDWVSGL